MFLDLEHPLWWTAERVLDDDECARWVRRIEAAPRETAPVSLPGGPVLDVGLRNNTRVIVDDLDYAAALWPRIAPLVPASLLGRVAVGLNERFRCYRYEPGQRFGPHYDGCFIRDENEQSLLTLLIYLSGDCEGGETAFLDIDVRIAPERGRALFFQHRVLHEGAPVTRGHKHVLRTDVMYRKR